VGSSDQFATSKANLRDTVKWLAATIAALAALVVAGAPFSDYGKLQPWTVRFFIASGGLLAAALLLPLVWLRLLKMLRSDAVFPAQLRSTYVPRPDNVDEKEIVTLRTHLSNHRGDLLPTDINSFEELESLVATEWANANAAPSNAALLERYRGYADNVEMYLNYATFARLHQRIESNVRLVIGLTAAAVIGLFCFAYAANPPEAGTSDRIVVVQAGAATDAESKPPALAPVRFRMGSARLDQQALDAISAARAFLREHDTSGLVLLAHTDTTGGEARNRTVAAQRGAAVRSMLLREGGISADRVFVAELPKADLPDLTLPQVPDGDNRTVEFMVVTMTKRQ
jgi:hypothetical protein